MRSKPLLALLALTPLCIPSAVTAGDTERTSLPAARTSGGKPLMDALGLRRSSREFSPEALPPQTVSDLLWAAFGLNRPESGGRTAPSARNYQEIDIYLATAEGLYLYDAAAHELVRILSGDIRRLTGTQEFVARAPVNLVYVADLARLEGSPPEEREFYAAADTGFISQNVYLFCASEGLATVVRALIDREALSAAMGLRPEQWITLAQSVGLPAP
jgi:nitroreductase